MRLLLFVAQCCKRSDAYVWYRAVMQQTCELYVDRLC